MVSDKFVFFTKKGFTVVITTKTGSSKELGELAKQAIEEILFLHNII
jgi:hypothetical protein